MESFVARSKKSFSSPEVALSFENILICHLFLFSPKWTLSFHKKSFQNCSLIKKFKSLVWVLKCFQILWNVWVDFCHVWTFFQSPPTRFHHFNGKPLKLLKDFTWFYFFHEIFLQHEKELLALVTPSKMNYKKCILYFILQDLNIFA